MNLSQLQTKLLGAARRNPPLDAVPYAFEKRVMHRLAARHPESALVWWGASLWRGAIACMAITLLCGLWAASVHKAPADTAANTNFSQDLQTTLFASMDQPGESE
jgi:anti-sigma-K factor RskA